MDSFQYYADKSGLRRVAVWITKPYAELDIKDKLRVRKALRECVTIVCNIFNETAGSIAYKLKESDVEQFGGCKKRHWVLAEWRAKE